MTGNMKLTKLEKAWVLYDVGNSAFILLVSTLLPIYFNAAGRYIFDKLSGILGLCNFGSDNYCGSFWSGAGYDYGF